MHHAGTFLASAAALLLASGCVTGIDVGHDGTGGSTTTTSSGSGTSTTGGTGSGSSGGGGQMPTSNACASPGALLCPWGQAGGPCGGGGQDCAAGSGLVCVGDSPGAPGTCAGASASILPPGGACGAGVADTSVCPWDYACNASFSSDGVIGVGICVPGNCVLSVPTPFVSAASITIDGDGPTQHDDFACGAQNGGSHYTGEANAFLTPWGSPPSPGWLNIMGCASPGGYASSLNFDVPLSDVGTAHMGSVIYVPPPPLGTYGNFETNGVVAPMTVTVTEMNADVVEGSFDVVVTAGPPLTATNTRHLTGTFDVCRLPFDGTFPPL
jgi:hypothetical protein